MLKESHVRRTFPSTTTATTAPSRPVAHSAALHRGESSVLGGLLLDNGAWDRVADLLTDSDFYRYEHRLVWRAPSAR
jgi:hypothetical protein